MDEKIFVNGEIKIIHEQNLNLEIKKQIVSCSFLYKSVFHAV